MMSGVCGIQQFCSRTDGLSLYQIEWNGLQFSNKFWLISNGLRRFQFFALSGRWSSYFRAWKIQHENTGRPCVGNVLSVTQVTPELLLFLHRSASQEAPKTDCGLVCSSQKKIDSDMRTPEEDPKECKQRFIILIIFCVFTMLKINQSEIITPGEGSMGYLVSPHLYAYREKL